MANDNTTGTFNLKLAPRDTAVFALDDLHARYGENFQYLGPWGSSMDGSRELLVSCDSLPGQRILVHVSNYRDTDARSVSDNYLACFYAQETEAFLKTCAEETIGSARIIYTPTMLPLPASLPANLPFDLFLSESGVFLSFTVEVKASDLQSEEQARALVQRYADSGAAFHLNIVSVPDDVFGTLSRDELFDRIDQRDYARYVIASCEDGSIRFELKEGAI